MKLSTFSIVARDEATGQLGVAGGTNWFCYGRWVPHIEAGFGALATQAETNMEYSVQGLSSLRSGKNAEETLQDALQKSPDLGGVFQLLIIDNQGTTACHTGNICHDFAGSILEQNLGVAGNTLVSKDTLVAVVETYKKNSDLLFGLRLIKALQAGQAAGGDIRGMKSAALKIAKGNTTGVFWEDVLYDLRVDEHKDPLAELERLFHIAEAYDAISIAESSDSEQEALAAYQRALEKDPVNPEILFSIARIYARQGKLAESNTLRERLKTYPGNWEEYWKRMDSH